MSLTMQNIPDDTVTLTYRINETNRNKFDFYSWTE